MHLPAGKRNLTEICADKLVRRQQLAAKRKAKARRAALERDAQEAAAVVQQAEIQKGWSGRGVDEAEDAAMAYRCSMGVEGGERCKRVLGASDDDEALGGVMLVWQRIRRTLHHAWLAVSTNSKQHWRTLRRAAQRSYRSMCSVFNSVTSSRAVQRVVHYVDRLPHVNVSRTMQRICVESGGEACARTPDRETATDARILESSVFPSSPPTPSGGGCHPAYPQASNTPDLSPARAALEPRVAVGPAEVQEHTEQLLMSLEATYEVSRTMWPHCMHSLEQRYNLTAFEPPLVCDKANVPTPPPRGPPTPEQTAPYIASTVECTSEPRLPQSGELPARYWSNALAAPLPYAPRMQIHCMYGVGLEAERAYHYEAEAVCPCRDSPPAVMRERNSTLAWDIPQFNGLDDELCVPDRISADGEVVPAEPVWAPTHISTDVHAPAYGIVAGTQVSDGDATVPLMSLGWMCVKGWKDSRRNPAGIEVVTREYEHNTPASRLVELGIYRAGTAAHNDSADVQSITDDSAKTSHRSGSGRPKTTETSKTQAPAWMSLLPDEHFKALFPRYQALTSAMDEMLVGALGSDERDIGAYLHFAKQVLRGGLLRATVDLIRSGGGNTGHHVDILMNLRVIEDILQIATGQREKIDDHVVSGIRGIAENINV